jgi:predicted esterase
MNTKWEGPATYPKARLGVWRRQDKFAFDGAVFGHSLGGKLALACAARCVVVNANPFIWEVNTKQVWMQLATRHTLLSLSQMERLAARLVKCGCDVQLHVVNGAPHRWLWEMNEKLSTWISKLK